MADDDRLLAVALDPDVDVHIHEVFALALIHLIHGDGKRVRQFVSNAFECGFTNQLADSRLDGLVGNRFIWVELVRDRQFAYQQSRQFFELVGSDCRDRNNRRPLAHRLNSQQLLG